MSRWSTQRVTVHLDENSSLDKEEEEGGGGGEAEEEEKGGGGRDEEESNRLNSLVKYK